MLVPGVRRTHLWGFTSQLASALTKLALCLVLLGMATQTHAHNIYVAPIPLYQFESVQDCGCGQYAGPWETSLSAAFADAAGEIDGTRNGVSWTALGPPAPQPNTYYYNGVALNYVFSVQSCQTGDPCQTLPNTGYIDATFVCPSSPNFASSLTHTGTAPYETAVCSITVPDAQASPHDCKTCTGNPIYPASGQKVQSESDYSGVKGMSFIRTYGSNNGFFSSIVTQTFLNNSSSSVAMTGCLQAPFSYQGASGIYCFPYSSGYPVTSTSQYEVQSSDGRSILFTGPNTAVTQAADINDRVTMLTVSGATEWQVQREDDTIELYNASGELIQKTLRGGLVLTYTYSTSSTPTSVAPFPGLLLSQSDPFGHTLSWTYNSLGQMTQMTDLAGGIYTYAYDTYTNLTSVTYPDSTVRTYWYNESGNTGGANLTNALTGITDESSTRFATFEYMIPTTSYVGAPFATNTQHAGGVESYSINYPSSDDYGEIQTATVTDPLGTSRTYNFHLYSNLSYNDDTSQTQPAASGSGTVTQEEAYDSNGNQNIVIDYNGDCSGRVFNQTRNLETSRTEGLTSSCGTTTAARTTTTSWNSSFRVPQSISVYAGSTASGTPIRTTTMTYDSYGNMLTKTVTDPATGNTRTWTYTYDTYGRMLTAKGPRTDVNSTYTYAYYTCTTGGQCGELQTVTDPIGNVTTYNTYNGHGQPLMITDPNGVVTTLTYDARARLTSRQVGTETTRFSYYPTGLLKQVTLPDGSYVVYTYDAAHRLTEISDGAGNSVQYTLDNMGNRTAEKTYDPSGTLHRTHTRAYGALNTLYQDINAAGTSGVSTTYGYDNDANQTSIAAPLSRNTVNTFDALNRLSQITDPNSGHTSFTYDSEDDLLTVKDPKSLTTTYSYNGFGDLSSQVSPDTGSTANTYDSGGNLSTSTDARGAISSYAYDAANRVTSIAYKLGSVTDQTIAFGYDSGTYGKGRLTSASDANHSLSWTYDFAGRVVGKGLTVGSTNLSVGYGYTNADRTALVTPSGQSVAYGFSSDHQITSIKVNGATVISSVTYEPFGGVNGWTWGDGTTVSRTFNGDGLIDQIVTAGVTLGYSFDNANRITGISDSSNSALTWAYGYDLLDRLTSATTSAITDGWTYDANGNRLTQTGTTAITFGVSSTSNQLNSTTGGLTRSYSYDAAGHTDSYGTLSFTYNNRGRMEATSADSTDYLYNALGQMYEKSGTLGTTLFMQDEAGHLIGEYSANGNLIEETVWLGDIPVATLQPNGSGGVNLYYVHSDQLNAPRKIAEPTTDQLVWRWDTDPFGTVSPNQNPSGLGTFVYNLRLPGQYYMEETGLNQNLNRDYDPIGGGRYIESDHIGLAGGLNTYSYALNNPASTTDEGGNCPICIAVWVWLAENGATAATALAVTTEVALNVPNPVSAPVSAVEQSVATGGVYLLRSPVTRQVMRIGRTCDIVRREGEHARNPLLKDLIFEAAYRTDSYAEQRGLEQMLYNQYNPPLNLINPISPSNPNLNNYMDAASMYLQSTK
jgi:RHS repeat-associated protein